MHAAELSSKPSGQPGALKVLTTAHCSCCCAHRLHCGICHHKLLLRRLGLPSQACLGCSPHEDQTTHAQIIRSQEEWGCPCQAASPPLLPTLPGWAGPGKWPGPAFALVPLHADLLPFVLQAAVVLQKGGNRTEVTQRSEGCRQGCKCRHNDVPHLPACVGVPLSGCAAPRGQ